MNPSRSVATPALRICACGCKGELPEQMKAGAKFLPNHRQRNHRRKTGTEAPARLALDFWTGTRSVFRRRPACRG